MAVGGPESRPEAVTPLVDAITPPSTRYSILTDPPVRGPERGFPLMIGLHGMLACHTGGDAARRPLRAASGQSSVDW
jgi:hypothetical protein